MAGKRRRRRAPVGSPAVTAVATPPAEATVRRPGPPATAPAPSPPPPRPAAASLRSGREVALAAVTLVTVAGHVAAVRRRLVLRCRSSLHAVAAHVVVAVLRRRGVGIAASAAVVAGCAAVAVVWGHLWHTTCARHPDGRDVPASPATG